jgi:hypothetical protein
MLFYLLVLLVIFNEMLKIVFMRLFRDHLRPGGMLSVFINDFLFFFFFSQLPEVINRGSPQYGFSDRCF